MVGVPDGLGVGHGERPAPGWARRARGLLVGVVGGREPRPRTAGGRGRPAPRRRRLATGSAGDGGGGGRDGAARPAARDARRGGRGGGAADAEAAAGAASRLVDSLTSVAALRNSRMLLPSADPTSGSLPGPTTMSAMIRTMMSSPGPMLNGISWIDLVVGSVPARAASEGRQGSTARRLGPLGGGRREALAGVRRSPAGGSSRAARAMPRDTLTSRPPPGGPPAGAAVAGPAASTGATSPPWAPTPGTRNARPGRDRRGSPPSSAGAVAPTTRPTVPPGPQPAARRATRAHSGSAGLPARRVARPPRGPGAPPRPGWRSGTARRRTGPRARAAARSPPRRGTG